MSFLFIRKYTNSILLLQVFLWFSLFSFYAERFGELNFSSYIYAIKLNEKIMAEKTVNVDMLDFVKYLDVRDSGVTNMFDLRNVTALTGLSKEQIMYIMKNFSELEEKYC
jgi:hypothetical protein